MKKAIVFLLSAVLTLHLAACGGQTEAGTGAASAASSAFGEAAAEPAGTVPEEAGASGAEEAETSAGTETEAAEAPDTASAEEETAGETGKTLVVYYSASGNTKRVAQEIAAAAEADLFEIVPEEPYTDDDLDWTDDNSRVSREHEDESLRDVPLSATEVPNWDSYDTVLIGYPIWWGIAAWPTNGFVSANDFTGKTVIPFATSSSSDMGESGTILEGLAGTGSWQEGRRFSSGASAEDIQAWISELGL